VQCGQELPGGASAGTGNAGAVAVCKGHFQMNNPRQILLISLAGALLMAGMILFGSDGVSPTLRLMQYLFLGLSLVGVVGAMIQLRK